MTNRGSVIQEVLYRALYSFEDGEVAFAPTCQHSVGCVSIGCDPYLEPSRSSRATSCSKCLPIVSPDSIHSTQTTPERASVLASAGARRDAGVTLDKTVGSPAAIRRRAKHCLCRHPMSRLLSVWSAHRQARDTLKILPLY